MSTTITELLRTSEQRLNTVCDSPRLDSELLLASVLNKPRSYLFTWPDQSLTDEQENRFLALLERRTSGEPLAYILGNREFWSMPLKVSPGTLIPRPDTELLVEQALQLLPEHETHRVLDLGTGSGAIALAIASERPMAYIVATDQSVDALTIARENANQHDFDNLKFIHGSWFSPLPGEIRFDLIVSNPPYIAEDDPHLLQGDLPSEPRSALVSGADGLDDIRHIIGQAPQYLVHGGYLILEHGYDQGEAVRTLFHDAGFLEVNTRRDLAGQDRVTQGHLA
jgi:release factor glutamine methyltransferase